MGVTTKSMEIIGLSFNKNKVTEYTKLMVSCKIMKVNGLYFFLCLFTFKKRIAAKYEQKILELFVFYKVVINALCPQCFNCF